MTRMALFVVTLYPYEDGGEARYQFTDYEQARRFASVINELPERTRAYLSGTGKPVEVTPWESSTYESVEEALEELNEWLPEDQQVTEVCPHEHIDREDDGLDRRFFVCLDCNEEVVLSEPDEDGKQHWEVPE